MFRRLDPNDPESLSKFVQETAPDAAMASIRQAIVLGWWLLPADQRNDDNLEREIRRLVDDAIRDFRADRDRFLNPEYDVSDPTSIALARDLILKIGQKRFGAPSERIRQSLLAITEGERLKTLLEQVHSASGWDDLMAKR
jgi:hypothetical protein